MSKLTATTGPRSLRRSTQVLTEGFDPHLSVGSARPAVFRSSTYVFTSPEAAERAMDVAMGRMPAEENEKLDLIYSRLNHPNAQMLEDHLVPLEPGAENAVVFNSGMAATMTALLAFLQPGKQLIYTVPAYGGTQHFIQEHLNAWGVHCRPVAAGDHEALTYAIERAHDLGIVLIETPVNPTLQMTDLRRVSDDVKKWNRAKRSHRAVVMVDNTMLGPTFQHPLALGADLVLYSATKYLSGFSDLLAGAVVGKDRELTERVRLWRSLFGNILQPDECWMLDGRLPTVGLRMSRASKNAQRIAERLATHPAVKRVFYPTLFQDPQQREIYKLQCDYPGAVFSLEFSNKKQAFEFLRHLQIARNAVSLGGAETLVCHPKTTTHSGFSEGEAAVAGVSDGLVRVSVGIEDWRDLLLDFEQALDKASV